MYEMKITTETAKGTKVQRTTCYTDEQVAKDREFYRSLAPRGATQTITVKPIKH